MSNVKTQTSNRVVFEKKIGRPESPFFKGSMLCEFFKVSPNSKRVAYVTGVGKKCFMVVDVEKGRQCDKVGGLVFSPDSQWVAYVASIGKKYSVVVDGKEGKQYDMIEGLIFSPDSRRVAYAAQRGNKHVVVVDKQEGNQYDGLGTQVGGRIIFDFADSLHYLAVKDDDLYLIEERVE